tara:strand:+ start:4358 stop:5212 length:855 start_codon:yes stop_codon:yes gene_type:complete
MEYLMPSNDEYIHFQASTIETIDTGLYEWLDNTLDVHTKTNKGIYKVPILWLGTERIWQIKKDVRIRDKVGKLILPLITVNRSSMAKDPSFKGSYQANIPENNDYRGGTEPVGSTINQDKTKNFQSTIKQRGLDNTQQTGKLDENNQVVYNNYTAPIPVYIAMTYSITLRTEYQQQMNDLMQPFIATTGQINSFIFKKEQHKYEAFIQQDYSMNNNAANIGEEERVFETKIDIKVLGYISGEGYSRKKPLLARRENQVKVRFTSERSMVGDKIPWKKKDKDYRE